MGKSRFVVAIHSVFSGYGTWLSNDPRGSGSTETRKPELDELGEVHFGRKRDGPTREELREFYRNANPRLDFPPFWFDASTREAIALGFESAAVERRYTVWACAVCSNHAHLVVRTHRDKAGIIWDAFANGARRSVIARSKIDPGHPLWASRPYNVFLYAPDEVRGRIDYVRRNPMKEGLSEQVWPFVKPYDGWPEHKRK